MKYAVYLVFILVGISMASCGKAPNAITTSQMRNATSPTVDTQSQYRLADRSQLQGTHQARLSEITQERELLQTELKKIEDKKKVNPEPAQPVDLDGTFLNRELQIVQKLADLDEEERRIELAITYLEDGVDSFDNIRVRILPVGRSSRVKTHKAEIQIYNRNGLQVSRIDPINGRRIEVIGEAENVQISLNCMNEQECDDNRIFLDGDEVDPIQLSELLSRDLRQRHAILVSPKKKPVTTPTRGVTTTEEMLDDGFTRVRWTYASSGQTARMTDGFYRGELAMQYSKFFRNKFDIDKEGVLKSWSLINVVNLEEYLYGVVPEEIQTSSHLEALKAQATAARTYALKRSQESRLDYAIGWDVDRTTKFQKYDGAESEHANTTRAVKSTHRTVIASKGRVALSEYHACSTPQTKSASENPVLRTRQNPTSEGSCSVYYDDEGKFIGGHGRGMCQSCIRRLAKEGWQGSREPTQSANLPTQPEQPWKYSDILRYYYDGTTVENLDNVAL